jgi:hypothetical protein
MPDLTGKMQTGRDVPPVVDHPRLARMKEGPVRARKIGGKELLMPDEPKADRGKQRRMAPFKKSTAGTPKSEYPDQQERRTAAERPQGYVRLRVRVEDNELYVVGAHAVEGPLVERTKLHGDLAYEVTMGTKLLAADAVPDVGVRRSFPDPSGDPERQGHFVTPLDSYELNVRVPKEDVSLASLPKLEITLYRIKEEVPRPLTAAGPVGPQFERELRPVAQMKGIRREELAQPVREELEKAIS